MIQLLFHIFICETSALGEQFASYLPSTLPKVVEAMQVRGLFDLFCLAFASVSDVLCFDLLVKQQQYEQTRVVTAAVCCLSDISRAVSTKLVPNAKPLIQALLQGEIRSNE